MVKRERLAYGIGPIVAGALPNTSRARLSGNSRIRSATVIDADDDQQRSGAARIAASKMKNLPRKPAVNGTPASEAMAMSMAKARKGERCARAVEIFDLHRRFAGHDDEDEKLSSVMSR